MASIIIEPKIFDDRRGYFYKSFSQWDFDTVMGKLIDLVQDNQSYSHYGV